MKSQKLIKLLKRRKIKPIAVFKASKRIDDMLYITEHVYIQLGKNYVFVVNDSPKKFSMRETNSTIKDIVLKLKEAISE
jgi:hypothetical protein